MAKRNTQAVPKIEKSNSDIPRSCQYIVDQQDKWYLHLHLV